MSDNNKLQNLAQFAVNAILEEAGNMEEVVIYSGRFQPFHPGHHDVYQHLVKKFGKDNVYIATSNKTNPKNSPLNFKEKKNVITTLFNVPSSKVVQIKNPYSPTEILKQYKPETTAYITVVGPKDRNRLKGKYFDEYSDNLPLQGYKDKGYVYVVTDAATMNISATKVRHAFSSVHSEEEHVDFFKKIYPKFDKRILQLFQEQFADFTSSTKIEQKIVEQFIIEQFPTVIKEVSQSGGPNGSDADDGPVAYYDGMTTFSNVSKRRAEMIGYQLIKQITDGEFEDIDTDYPEYPDGPVKAVSSFPAGVIGKLTATNQEDFDDIQAYKRWFDHVTRSMALAGYELIKFDLSKKGGYSGEEIEQSIEDASELKDDEAVNERTNSFLSKSEIESIVESSLEELQIGYPSKEQYEKKKRDLKKLQDKLVKDREQDKEYTPVKESKFDRSKYYLEHFRNVAPTDFEIYLENNHQIHIKLPSQYLSEEIQNLSSSLDIDRTKMPQIDSDYKDELIEWLTEHDIVVIEKEMQVGNLKAAQKHFDSDKVKEIIDNTKGGRDIYPIWVSEDGYVIDGLHRTIAAFNIDKEYVIDVYEVGYDLHKAIEIINEFPSTTRKSVVESVQSIDSGKEPFVLDIHKATRENDTYRTVKWTGNNLQMTLMSINVGSSVGLEKHDTIDQFLRLEQGTGITKMGKEKDNLTFEEEVSHDSAVFVPAGYYHNIINTGDEPLKLYAIYAPPNHPEGRIDIDKPSTHELKEAKQIAESSLQINIPRDIRDIHKAFKKSGKKLYIVGGAVRDAILGKNPKDIDLATDAKPDEVLRIAKRAGYNTVEVGKQFGVVIVGGHEIATFRNDIGKGRKPSSVEYTDIEGDVRRRDLTINALFYDMEKEEIVDLVGGIEDLKRKQVRTVGDPNQRFDEDPLRKLRAIRFVAAIGGTLDGDTYQALRSDPSLKGVSPERARDEFLKGIKKARSVADYLQIAEDVALLNNIFPKQRLTKPFIDDRNPALVIAHLLPSEKFEYNKKYLNKLTYTTEEIRNISLLQQLEVLSIADNIVNLKRQQKHATLTDQDIIRFGKNINKNLAKFVNFNLKVKGGDIAKQGYSGPEIGNEVSRREQERYLNESQFNIKPGFTFKANKSFQKLKRNVEYVVKDIQGKIGDLVIYVQKVRKGSSSLVPVHVRSIPEFYKNAINVNVPNFYSEQLKEENSCKDEK